MWKEIKYECDAAENVWLIVLSSPSLNKREDEFPYRTSNSKC